jgi:hypothetical protein
MINAIAGVGTLAIGVLGGPAIGVVQDRDFTTIISQRDAQLAQRVLIEKPGVFGESSSLDQEKIGDLTEAQKEMVDEAIIESKQGTLKKIAILPAIMFLCYVTLIVYFRSRGGYRTQTLPGREPQDVSLETAVF